MLKLASTVGLGLAVANLRQRIRSAALRGMVGAIGALVLLVALVFLLVATHLWLSELINPIASAAIIGGVLLLVAFVLLLIAGRPVRTRAKAAENPVEETMEGLHESASRLGAALGPPFNNPVLLAAGLALLVGFLLGRRRKRRDED